MERLTIEQLIAKKDHQSPEVKMVHLDSLGGDLEIKKIPLGRYMEMNGRVEKAADMAEVLSIEYEMIYACCPILHSQRLQEAYECRDPLEIVPKLFDDNLSDLNTIMAEIATFYGVNIGDDLKN